MTIFGQNGKVTNLIFAKIAQFFGKDSRVVAAEGSRNVTTFGKNGKAINLIFAKIARLLAKILLWNEWKDRGK